MGKGDPRGETGSQSMGFLHWDLPIWRLHVQFQPGLAEAVDEGAGHQSHARDG